MARIPKDLLARLEYFNREVEELFQRLFGADFSAGMCHDDNLPCLDLLETEEEILLRADLPGIARDAVDIHVAPSYIVLRGSKEADESRHGCLRLERTFGAFQRLVPLPVTVDVAKVTARLSRGVLEIRAPKLPERRKGQRRIKLG